MRMAAELGLLVLVGAFLGVTGPYGTAYEPLPARFAFWLLAIVAGGAIGIAIDALLRRRIARDWPRAFATALAMTPPITALVFAEMAAILGHDHGVTLALALLFGSQVLVISLAVMALRTLVRRSPQPVVAPSPSTPPADAAAQFRARLSARRRGAKLLAIEAHDHYVRVHTDAGAELLSLRFADALAELEAAPGFRIHRSWWVAADAIASARWRRGSGEVVLEDGTVAPISRSGAPGLRAAGWL